MLVFTDFHFLKQYTTLLDRQPIYYVISFPCLLHKKPAAAFAAFSYITVYCKIMHYSNLTLLELMTQPAAF